MTKTKRLTRAQKHLLSELVLLPVGNLVEIHPHERKTAKSLEARGLVELNMFYDERGKPQPFEVALVAKEGESDDDVLTRIGFLIS